jgi:hypothetical protein
MKRKPSKLDRIEFRLDHLEFALMNLMFVVANQKEELPKFKKSLDKAESMSKIDKDFLSLIVNDEGAEA